MNMDTNSIIRNSKADLVNEPPPYQFPKCAACGADVSRNRCIVDGQPCCDQNSCIKKLLTKSRPSLNVAVVSVNMIRDMAGCAGLTLVGDFDERVKAAADYCDELVEWNYHEITIKEFVESGALDDVNLALMDRGLILGFHRIGDVWSNAVFITKAS